MGNNLAPLIDVLFLLLIFLLVTASFDRRQVIDVALPEASDAREAPDVSDENERILTLRADGSLAWNNQRVTLDQLTEALAERPPEERLLPIFIRGDRDAALGRGIELLDQLRAIGYRNCLVEVAPAPK